MLKDEGMSKNLEKKAYAKINLGLDVTGRLPNGYHEVRMIMQTVGIYDVLRFEKKDSGIEISTDSGELPINEDNLIYKAAKLMMDRFNVTEGVRIHLTKNIPIAAGMAGGSTDAAATLNGLNELFELGADDETLREIGVKIGADVPYCVMGGTALAEGIGEKLTALKKAPDCFLLVEKPDINVSTKYVYEHLDAMETLDHPDIDGMINAIEEENLDGVVSRLKNVLESVTVQQYPIISEIKEDMYELGAKGCLMSGSGPTVFGIFTDEQMAKDAFAELKKRNKAKQIFLTEFV